MPIIFNLTTPEAVTPEPVFRDATEVDVDSYMLESVYLNADSAGASVYGLENGITARSIQMEPLTDENFRLATLVPWDETISANDITTDETATSGTTTSVTVTGAGWTTDEFLGKVIIFTGGTNGNADGSVRAHISGNTSDTISFTFTPADEFASACDNTTTFLVKANVITAWKNAVMLMVMDQLGKVGSLG